MWPWATITYRFISRDLLQSYLASFSALLESVCSLLLAAIFLDAKPEMIAELGQCNGL